jgi:alpha-D-xyloside xylohydrolase
MRFRAAAGCSAENGKHQWTNRLILKWTTKSLLLMLAMTPCMSAQPSPEPTTLIQSVKQDATGVSIHFVQGTLRIRPCMPNVARITYSDKDPIPEISSPFLSATICEPTPFTLQDDPQAVGIHMPDLTVKVDRVSGAVRFETADGADLLRESNFPQPRKITSVVTDGETTNRASVWFALTPEERFYGLGQHQNGLLNQRNTEIELSQDNTNISVPFFLSSQGYGVLWNNGSVTNWNNRFQPVLNISSQVADAVDYFFMNGPGFDKIIQDYRKLTGDAPMFPLWAYGYWQSKYGYKSQQEMIEVAEKYRSLHIPLDNIVLDEEWETVLGSHVFNDQFPDPRAMVQKLHDEHVHVMVSMWPVYRPGSANYDSLLKDGLFIGEGTHKVAPWTAGTRLYDAFSEKGRAAYWQQAKSALFDIGVDAFWLDSTEPSDNFGEEQGSMLAGAPTAMGNGSRYRNLFPFMTTAAIYDGQRSATDRKRVFILTRSGFAGMQHHAAAAWSGDVATNFQTLKRQITAGLNYSMSGLPYWTTDIGGFLGGDTNDPAYQEVFVRWFQYGAFCPIFRVHGIRDNRQNELWSYGTSAQAILTNYDRLRYRLLPYIYTLAGQTTNEGYTPMRALAFDFLKDQKALDTVDEFMFGPSILVAPVTDAGIKARRVYLPEGADWYDFWTGEKTRGGREVDRTTPLSTMPLYVRAGSILPMGPESEYSDQYPEAPIELRIYAGHDASAEIYEDDGASYDYEKGLRATIPLDWNDETKVLTIGARQGNYPGMETHRTFSIVLADRLHGLGEAVGKPVRTIQYDGTLQKVSLRQVNAPQPHSRKK